MKQTQIEYDGEIYEITIPVMDGIYYAEFPLDGKTVSLRLYPKDQDVEIFIEDLAQWKVEEYVMKYRLDQIMDEVTGTEGKGGAHGRP